MYLLAVVRIFLHAFYRAPAAIDSLFGCGLPCIRLKVAGFFYTVTEHAR